MKSSGLIFTLTALFAAVAAAANPQYWSVSSCESMTYTNANAVELNGASTGQFWAGTQNSPSNSAAAIGFNYTPSALPSSDTTGAGAGKVVTSPFTIWKTVDIGSPKVLLADQNNEVITSGVFTVQIGGASELVPNLIRNSFGLIHLTDSASALTMVYTFSNGVIEQFSQKGGEDRVVEKITLGFDKIQLSVKQGATVVTNTPAISNVTTA